MSSNFSTTLSEKTLIKKSSKSNFKILVCSVRKNSLSIIFGLFAIFLVVFSNTNFSSAKNGLILWATSVIPALFPFFVATELLSYTSIVPWLGKYLSNIMRPIFGIPGEGAFAFLMGLISGYPVGAKIVSDFCKQGICSKEEAQRMLAFTNNSGPLFIIGTVGISLFGNTSIGILLFITHVLSCISVGIILHIVSFYKTKFAKNNCYKKQYISHKTVNNFSHKTLSSKENKLLNFSSLGEILGNSITNSISTVLLIGGFVVIFSVVISILQQSHLLEFLSYAISPIALKLNISKELITPILSGIVELTNGVKLVANVPLKEISINIIVCAFLLGFGGISILLQVFSIISKCGLSIKTYFYGKLLQGILAAFYTFIAFRCFPWFQLNL